jgi:hypothetical protein
MSTQTVRTTLALPADLLAAAFAQADWDALRLAEGTTPWDRARFTMPASTPQKALNKLESGRW